MEPRGAWSSETCPKSVPTVIRIAIHYQTECEKVDFITTRNTLMKVQLSILFSSVRLNQHRSSEVFDS